MSTNTLRPGTGPSAVILDELETEHPEWAPLPDPGEAADQPIVIPGTDPVRPTRPVLVAVDDDDNAGAVLRQGRAMAAHLGVPLRAAYVWADCRTSECAQHRHCHRDLGQASRLLTRLLDEHVITSPGLPIEREVLRAADPAEALIALSAAASVLVVGSGSHRPAPGDALGDTTRRLLGRTPCPVVVVPHHRLSATRATW